MHTRSKEKGEIPERVTKMLGAHKWMSSDSEPGPASGHCFRALFSLVFLSGSSGGIKEVAVLGCHVQSASVPCLLVCFALFYIYFSNFYMRF